MLAYSHDRLHLQGSVCWLQLSKQKGLGLESHASSAAVISAVRSSALLANVVHQQKREG